MSKKKRLAYTLSFIKKHQKHIPLDDAKSFKIKETRGIDYYYDPKSVEYYFDPKSDEFKALIKEIKKEINTELRKDSTSCLPFTFF